MRGLWRQELETPGVYKRLIGEYRKAVEAAPAVPAGTAVVVPLAGLEPRARETLVKLADEAGGCVTAEAARIPWVPSDSIARVPILLSGKDVRWEVPERSIQDADRSVESEAEPLEQDRDGVRAVKLRAVNRGV